MTLLTALSGASPVGVTERPLARRGTMAEIWYPARSASATVPYLRDDGSLADLVAFYEHAGGWRLDEQRVRALRVAAERDAAPAPGRHPLVLFSHGRGASALQNTTRTSDLASHGFVVVALEHPRTSMRATGPDGSIARFDTAIPDDARTRESWLDLAAALDAITGLPASDPLSPAIDRGRVGAVGRAFGGGVVAFGGSRDARIGAVVNLGGDVATWPLDQPFAQLNSSVAPDRGRAQCLAGPGPATRAVVAGTGSTSYSDTPYLPWSVPPPVSATGTIATQRAAEILGRLVGSFLNEHLRSDRGAVAAVARTYPELRLETWR